MQALDREEPIVDWVIEVPESRLIFEKYGIDYSCGGKSMAYACRQQGCDPLQVLKEIQQVCAAGQQKRST